MSPDSSPPEAVPPRRWSWQLVIALGLLVAVWALSAAENALEKSIFPYAIAVGLVAWKHGLIAGFMFAAVATLVALASGAFPTHPTSVAMKPLRA